MSRIRTVKPELFKHEELFDAEQNSNLPLRLAYIGLFTAADCEGRFAWKPRTLKLDVLPHDVVDFSAVLDALERAGFIQRYTVDGKLYGIIPTFKKHQQIPTRESERGSSLPPPDPTNIEHEPIHAQARTEHEQIHAQARTEHCSELQEGKGREGKGNRKGKDSARTHKTGLPSDLAITPELQAWATEHGFVEDLCRHLEAFKDKAIAKGYQYADWNAALRNAIRDDWAGLRKNHQAPRNRTPATTTQQGSEFDHIMLDMSRPVIEGEIAHEFH